MPSTADQLDPSAHLTPGETLLWQGRPDPNRKLGGLVRIISLIGYVDLALFGLFAAIGWANRDALDGGGPILIGFLVLTLVSALVLLWGIPMVIRRGQANSRYAVTDSFVLLVQGPRVSQLRVRTNAEIEVVPDGHGLANVVFGRETVDLHTPHVPTVDPRGTTPILRLMQFQGLTPTDAEAARAALLQIRGKGGEGPIHETR